MQALIAGNAARLRALHEAIGREHQKDHGSPAHVRACEAFRSNYDALAFPGGLKRGLSRLKMFDSETVEIAVQFLLADPWFNQSGYIKQEIVQRLKHAPLTQNQASVLRELILRSVITGTPRASKLFASLAPAVCSPGFWAEIESKTRSCDERTALRAQQVVHCLRSAGIRDGAQSPRGD
jgi:hypothetical protein